MFLVIYYIITSKRCPWKLKLKNRILINQEEHFYKIKCILGLCVCSKKCQRGRLQTSLSPYSFAKDLLPSRQTSYVNGSLQICHIYISKLPKAYLFIKDRINDKIALSIFPDKDRAKRCIMTQNEKWSSQLVQYKCSIFSK